MGNFASVATMIWMFIGLCLAQALSVGWVARRDNPDGSSIFALGLGVHATAALFFAARGIIADIISIVLANALISAAYALYFLAVLVFLERPVKRITLILPPVLQVTGCLLMLDTMRGRVIFCTGVLLIQSLQIAIPLCRHPFAPPARGRSLLVFAIALAAISTGGRVAAAILTSQGVQSIFQPSNAQIAFLAVGFVSIILATNGFVLMTKERSDNILRNAALKDRLTGCWNRIRVEDCAKQELARLLRYGHPVSLMMIDLDHFKLVNDRFGHAVGDAVLRGFGELIRATVRTTDIAGRWGGEEFVIVLPSSSIRDVLPLAERLRTTLQRQVFASGLCVTASIGIALARSTDTWKEWLARADTALYAAKAAGRNLAIVEDMAIDASHLMESAGTYQLAWKASYETTTPEIDDEHRAIFAAANALLALGASPSTKAETLARAEPLLNAVQTHFAHEDRLLQRVVDEPGVRAHLEMHRYLIRRGDDLLERYKHGTVGKSALFHFIVFEYVAQHILIEDHKIAPRLVEAAQNRSARLSL